MAQKKYKVSSHPRMTDLQLQQLLRRLSNDGGPHTITPVLVDSDRAKDKQLIVVRVPDEQ